VSEAGETASGRRANKRAAVFRTIGEVAQDLDLPAHVLRFWESKFPQLKPLKRGGGRRYYRPEDIALLSRIRQCLYQEGYTIRGVQKLLAEGMVGGVVGEIAPSLFPLDPQPAPPLAAPRPARAARRTAVVEAPPAAAALSEAGKAKLEEAVQDLLSVRQMLDTLVKSNHKS
jgi:DNA-binding transcriptional MerR regulator